MQNNHLKNVSGLLLGSFIVSTAGPLGKYIALPSEVIIWFRCALAMVALYIFCKIKKIDLKVKHKSHYKPLIVSGIFMGLHWVTYFYGLKMAGVAIGMLSLYVFPVLITLLEPVFLKTRFQPVSIILGILVFVGVYILSPDFDINSTKVQGLLFGLCSALFLCFRFLILKQYVQQYNGISLMFYQVFIVSILLLPVLFFKDFTGLQTQLPYIVFLALITTAVGHSLIVHSLQFFSVSTASILTSAQPIFGIILAYFFLKEVPTLNTYIGGGLILLTVIIESVRSKKD